MTDLAVAPVVGRHDATPLVAVLLGTDHHRFDRLLGWAGELVADGTARCFVQHGSTPLPAGMEGAAMLGPVELEELILRADVVVCHGGPGLIMEARARGHVPVVVARDPALGEHVDDHQQRFLAFVGRRGLVRPADTLGDLRDAVGRECARSEHRDAVPSTSATAVRFGNLVDSLLQRP